MVPVAGGLIGKQAEKEKHIADSDPLIPQMGLRSPALSENTLPADKHWIFVAEMITLDPTPRDVLYDVAKAKVII